MCERRCRLGASRDGRDGREYLTYPTEGEVPGAASPGKCTVAPDVPLSDVPASAWYTVGHMGHEPGIRICTLGPAGTFSEQAALVARDHLGTSDMSICFAKTVPSVVDAVVGDAGSYGVIPIENSDAGTVAFSQDQLAQRDVSICLEIVVPVRFSLLSSGPVEEMEVLYVHPIALAQCSKSLGKYLALSVETTSNIHSKERFVQGLAGGEKVAAVVPVGAVQEQQGREAVRDIQNSARNVTRFLMVRSGPAVRDYTKDKTSVVVCPEENRSGLLHDILEPLRHHGLNLCRLESRPSHQNNWHYAFFIDFDNGPESLQAVAELERDGWGTRVLGCYDVISAPGESWAKR